jgi:hypothetical protein
MKAFAVETSGVHGLLAGAQFADSFAIVVGDALTARQAAEKMFNRRRGWQTALLKMRDAAVKPFGLRTTDAKPRAGARMIGIFPVISETPERVVAGFDDKHLDFRVIVDVFADALGTRVVVTTLVLKHNLLGHVYLAAIMPFHRMIVRSMLNGLARP